MIEAADRAQAVLMVGHNIRYGRLRDRPKTLVDDGSLGEIVSVEIHYSADNVQKGTHEGWRFQPAQCPLLPMMQLGIHAVDLAQYLIGPVREAAAHARSILTQPGVVDAVTGLLVFESGVVGTVVSNYCTPVLFQVRLAGTNGMLLVDWIPHRLTVLTRHTETEAPVVHDFAGLEGDELEGELREFADAVRLRRAPETDGPAGLRALAVVEAMSESAMSVETRQVPSAQRPRGRRAVIREGSSSSIQYAQQKVCDLEAADRCQSERRRVTRRRGRSRGPGARSPRRPRGLRGSCTSAWRPRATR